ncbi:MAG: BCCT family transporter, partial [Sphingomonadaceae bacterium]
MGAGTRGAVDQVLLALALPPVVGVAAVGLAAPDALRDAVAAATGFLLRTLGTPILLGATSCLLLLLWLGLGPWRRLRLGADDSRPEFGTLSWLAMLFAAGMGTGLVVWGAAEPVTHALFPPGGARPEAGSARLAILLTCFHWGLHAWAIYALCALVIGWFAFRLGRPALVSAPLAGLLPGRAGRMLERAADTVGIFAVCCGLAATLAMGMLSLGALLGPLAGGPTLRLGLLAILGGVALLSASTRLGQGIRWLSNANLLLAIAILLAILVLGPTARILATFIRGLADYLLALPVLSLGLGALGADRQWTADWSLTYLLWWLAWGPFVGVFIARISRGRTIGEFVAGVLLVPTLGSILWFAAFGGAGLAALAEEGPAGPIADAARTNAVLLLPALLQALPAGELLAAAVALLLAIFLVTSVDS